jgi:hypothetical protein
MESKQLDNKNEDADVQVRIDLQVLAPSPSALLRQAPASLNKEEKGKDGKEERIEFEKRRVIFAKLREERNSQYPSFSPKDLEPPRKAPK